MDAAQKFAQAGIAVAAFLAVMALLLLVVGRAPRRSAERWQVAAFVGPALVLLTIGLVVPAIRTTYQSFQDRNAEKFVGLENYSTLVTSPELLIVLRNTAIWVVLTPTLATVIGLTYAVVVDKARTEAFAKALIFLPMAISFVGASIIWKFVYAYRPDQPGVKQIGLLNQVLVWLGAEPRQFLLDPPINTVFILVIMVWIQAGFAMVILSAAIKGISADIVEAARLDGVSGWGMFRHVTLPSIRPAIVVVLTTITIATLKVFDIVRTTTGGNFDTSVIANEFYAQSFRYRNIGLGAALAVVLFVLVIPIIFYNVRSLRRAESR